jgi:hypothetical protein
MNIKFRFALLILITPLVTGCFGTMPHSNMSSGISPEVLAAGAYIITDYALTDNPRYRKDKARYYIKSAIRNETRELNRMRGVTRRSYATRVIYHPDGSRTYYPSEERIYGRQEYRGYHPQVQQHRNRFYP